MEIRTYRDIDGRWRWTLHDARGRALEQGEAHKTRAEARRAADERLAQITAARTERAKARRRATLARKKATGRGPR